MIKGWKQKAAAVVISIAAAGLTLHLCVPHPLFNVPTSTVITDKNGNLIGARISRDEQWRFPPSDSIPDKFAKCIIAFEDRRFAYHPGIDAIATMRALLHNIQHRHVAEGGSTLTMQLARMARGNQHRTIRQKLIEAAWAIDIELTYSKAEILRLYASNAPFGGNTVGLEAAAWRYFGRSAAQLSWAECATLAVLPNAPALIHLSRNRERLKTKRDALLKYLMEEGTLSQQEYSLALCEPLPQAPMPIPNQAPQLLTYLASRNEGKQVQSSIDLPMQILVQQIADRYSTRYKANYINDVAIIVADVETGEVLAYVGNSSQQSSTSQVDNIRSQRSTGSLLKPILYAAMLSSGEISPSTIFADTPLNLNGFTPMNFSKTYRGIAHADEAVTRSLNVPLVRMLSQYGIGRFMTVLKWLGMTTLHYDEEHYGASIILGGAEGSLWDMTGMYASMSRMLNHYHPSLMQYNSDDVHPLKLEKAFNSPQRDEKAVENKGSGAKASRLSAASIWFAYQAMSALNRPEEEADWQNFSTMKQVAWKTGTSWGARDAWAIGTTPRYTVGVWVGNSTGEGRAGLTGVGYAAPIMFDVYTLLEGCDWFQQPLNEMMTASICKHSGHIASSICGDTEERYIPRTSSRSRTCPYCKLVHLSADGKWQVNSTGEPVSKIHTVSRFILPPTQEYYFASHTASYEPLPPLRQDCQGENREQISIITPEHGSEVMLPRNFGGTEERIVLKAACNNAEATLFWHIDDNYIGQTQGTHEITATPGIGQHSLTVVDDRGNRRTVLFKVR